VAFRGQSTANVLVALGLVIQGRASPGVPVAQTVRVETPGCAQVSCELSNDRGTWQLARTPGAVTLTTSQAPLTVLCRTAAGAEGGIGTPSSLAAASGAGAVAGGMVGAAGVGAAFGTVALTFMPVLGVIVVFTGWRSAPPPGQRWSRRNARSTTLNCSASP